MPQPSYAYAGARISALEKSLFGRDAVRRMAEGSLEDALRLLSDAKYGNLPDATGEDTERMIESVRKQTAETIRDLSPDSALTDLFLLQTPEGRCGLNHVAFTVRDIHEVFGGGMHISRCGWDTELGPGRHPVSSAIFWYVNSPLGALWEYYTDEDELTADWQPREFTPGPTVFAEWAIKGGIDGHTRRQLHSEAPSGKFMTDKPKA